MTTTELDLRTPEGRAAFASMGGHHPSKYGNRRVGSFDSQAEADRYDALLLMEHAGAISDLRIHPRYELQPAFTDYRGARVRAIVYEADFAYRERGRMVAEDVKGYRTKEFAIKEKLFRYRYPDIELRIMEV